MSLSHYNSSVFVGRLVDKVTFTEDSLNDRAKATGRLICNRQGKRGKYDVIPFVAWDKKATILNSYTSKGKQLLLSGSIRTNSYKDNLGNWKNFFELEVIHISLGESEGKTLTNE